MSDNKPIETTFIIDIYLKPDEKTGGSKIITGSISIDSYKDLRRCRHIFVPVVIKRNNMKSYVTHVRSSDIDYYNYYPEKQEPNDQPPTTKVPE